MSGFGRDKSVDDPGFRGIIPDNTIVPVLIIEGDGKLLMMKTGKNSGKTARIYKPVCHVVGGKYRGARIFSDIWCNVEPDPAGGEPKVFGSHMVFCDLCDATDVKDEDGDYPVAATEQDVKDICNRFVGHVVLMTVGIRTYKKKNGEDGSVNTTKSITIATDNVKEHVAEEVVTVKKRVAEWQAKKAAEEGATGFEDTGGNIPDDDDDDDLPF